MSPSQRGIWLCPLPCYLPSPPRPGVGLATELPTSTSHRLPSSQGWRRVLQASWRAFDPSPYTTYLPPIPRLSASPSWLAGALARRARSPASHLRSLPARNLLPSVFDFMSLHDICVATGHAAWVSVSHTTSYKDVTLFCHFPAQTTAVTTNTRKRWHWCRCCPSTTLMACTSTGSEPTTWHLNQLNRNQLNHHPHAHHQLNTPERGNVELSYWGTARRNPACCRPSPARLHRPRLHL